MLIVLLVAWTATRIVRTGDAAQAGSPGEGGRESGGEDTHIYASPEHKMNWITCEGTKAPEPSLLAVSAFVACVVLVALLSAVLIYRGRKHPKRNY
jgi:hypothetical protein